MITTDTIFVRCDGQYFRIRLKDITYIGTSDRYVCIYTEGRMYKTKFSLDRLESMLPPTTFCRIHRYHIVALDRVASFDYEVVHLEGEITLQLSDKYRKHFFSSVVLLNPVYSKTEVTAFSE